MTDAISMPGTAEQAGGIALALPAARGEVSAAVAQILRGRPAAGSPLPQIGDIDPYGEDLQLALHMCYELHYQGFDGVDAGWEWDPELLRLRGDLEQVFLAALRRDVEGGDEIGEALARFLVEPAEVADIGQYLGEHGQWWQLGEYFVQRSIYHHKEGDPHAWVIPRLRGQEKASLVAVEFDEFGGGHGPRMHAQLYGDLLTAAGLHAGYLHYLDSVPAPMLAVVNMMSLFGLHRELRGALVGHLATAEITSSPSARRMVAALERLDAAPACHMFYTEHIEADAVHEQVMRQVVTDLVAREPELAGSVVLGIQATSLLEDRFTEHMLERSWRAGRSSLRGDASIRT